VNKQHEQRNLSMTRRRRVRSLTTGVAILASAALAGAAASGATTAPKAPAPIVNTGYADQLTMSSATLRGSISPNGTSVSYYFEYGTTQAYGAWSTVLPLGTSSKTIHVSAAISGLSVYTTYQFRLVTIGPTGTRTGATHSFTTLKLPLSATMTAAPDPVVFGNSFVVSGTLSGTGYASHPVALQANPFPYLGTFKDVTAAELTTTTGAFSFVAQGFTQSTQLRVAAAASPPTYSPAVNELVAVRVSFHAKPTGRRGFVRLYGAVAPAMLGAHVGFQWLKPGGAVITVSGTTTKRGTANAAKFGRVVRIRHRGLYRVFVAVTNGKQVSGYSRTIAIR
jgi:hypothetical protein